MDCLYMTGNLVMSELITEKLFVCETTLVTGSEHFNN